MARRRLSARLTQKPVKTMLNKEKIKELLNQRFEKDIHKKLSEIPTPDALKDVFKGAERIKRAIEQNERSSSSAIMTWTA